MYKKRELQTSNDDLLFDIHTMWWLNVLTLQRKILLPSSG